MLTELQKPHGIDLESLWRKGKFDRRRSLRRQSIFFIAAITTVILSSIVAFFTLPERLVSSLVIDDINERTQEWYDEISKLDLIRFQNFEGVPIALTDQRSLTNLSRVGGQFRMSIFDNFGEAIWSTSDGTPPILAVPAESLASTYELDRSNDPIIFVHNITEKRLNAESGKEAPFIEGNMHHVAKAIIPFNDKGSNWGFIQVHYDIERIQNWYMSNIQKGIAVVGVLISLLALTSSAIIQIGNIRIARSHKQTRLLDTRNKEIHVRRSLEIQSLSELSEWLQTSNNLDEFFTLLENFLKFFFPTRAGAIFVFDEQRQHLINRCSWNAENIQIKRILSQYDCWALRRGRTYEFGKNIVNFKCDHVNDDTIEGYICIPIMAHGEALGMMHLIGDNMTDDKKMAKMCSEQISMSLANVTLRTRLEERTLRDPLTGLYNRRGLDTHIDRFITHVAPNNPFYLVACDLDHFKPFNDNFGHDAGDHVLERVSKVFLEHARGMGFRVGGEEFVLLLDPQNHTDIKKDIDSIRIAISELRLETAGKKLPEITCSFGVSIFPTDATESVTLNKEADDALYAAKQKGRNCIVYSGEPEEKTNLPTKAPKLTEEVIEPVSPLPNSHTNGVNKIRSNEIQK